MGMPSEEAGNRGDQFPTSSVFSFWTACLTSRTKPSAKDDYPEMKDLIVRSEQKDENEDLERSETPNQGTEHIQGIEKHL